MSVERSVDSLITSVRDRLTEPVAADGCVDRDDAGSSCISS